MIKPVLMPHIGLGGEDVIAGEWRVRAGEAFETGQPLLEIETDKATMDVEAPFAGTLLDQRVAVGETVAVGAVIAYAAEPGADLEAAGAALADVDGADTPAAVAMDNPSTAARPASSVPAPLLAGAHGDALMTFVEVEHGELSGIPPDAARRAVAAPTAAAAPAAPVGRAASLDDRAAAGPARRRELSRRRRAIARRMEAAARTPTFVVTREVPAERARSTVARWREAGLRVTLTDVLLHACGVAGTQHPSANAWMLDDELLEFTNVNVGLAVDAPDGVTAPVVRAVDGLTLPGIATARADLVARARDGALEASELLGGTVTLSNAAGLGLHSITPVLTAPQAVAVGVGSSRAAGGGEVVTVSFVGDHRVLDGADGARYLASFADALHELPTPD